MTTITEQDVVQACHTIFGRHINVSKDFLSYMQPSGVKSAYRKLAKETHPDLYAAEPVLIQQKQTALFQEIIRAYDVLNLFFKQREDGAWRRTAPAAAHRPTERPHQKEQHQNDKQQTRPHHDEKQHAGPHRTERRSKPRPTAEDAKRADETFYHGMMPFRTLQIGQFLYYRGKISFGSLINALVWQRKQRPTFGEIAHRWGWLDEKGLSQITKATDRPRKFGEKAVELGLLTVFQANAVLLYQRSLQYQLGRFFVENSILAEETIERLVQELKEHNAAVLASTRRHAAQAMNA